MIAWNILCIVGLLFCQAHASKEHVTCGRTYKKLGCGAKASSVMTELLINDRDVTSDRYEGYMLNWKKFGESVHSLACRCAAKAAKEGYEYFGIRFFAECYGTKASLDMTKVGLSNECIGPDFKKCVHSHSHECVGKLNSEYLYQTVSKIPTEEPSVDGGYSTWSDWGKCTAPCGTKGEQSRERLCNNPPPSGKNGKDCSTYGPSTELRPCNRHNCPEPVSPCPEMLGSYGHAVLSTKDGHPFGDWITNGRPNFSGVFKEKCEGDMTFPDDRKYTFKYDATTCRIYWDSDKNHIWQKKDCKTGSKCPAMMGNYGHATLSMKHGYPFGDWTTNARPDFSGVFVTPCKGEMVFPDDRKYTFEYDAKSCTIYWDGDKNHIWRKTSCGARVLISRNFPLYAIGVNHGVASYIMNGEMQSFKIISPGLNGKPNSVSFMSATKPNHYLRHQGWLLKLHPYSNKQLYKDDATFFIRPDKFFPGFAAFESSNYPGHFLRHQGYRMKLHKYANQDLYKNDASFKISDRLPSFPDKKIVSYNYPEYFIGDNGRGASFIIKGAPQFFKIVSPGLNGREGSVSFMSVKKPHFYLRHQGWLLKVHPLAFTNLYRDDATFYIRENKFFPGYVAFESSNYPGHFLRHQGYRMKLHKYENADLYRKDASYKFV